MNFWFYLWLVTFLCGLAALRYLYWVLGLLTLIIQIQNQILTAVEVLNPYYKTTSLEDNNYIP